MVLAPAAVDRQMVVVVAQEKPDADVAFALALALDLVANASAVLGVEVVTDVIGVTALVAVDPEVDPVHWVTAHYHYI